MSTCAKHAKMQFCIKSFLGISLAAIIIIILGYFVIPDVGDAKGQIQNSETLDGKLDTNDLQSSGRDRDKKIEQTKVQANNKGNIGKAGQATTRDSGDGSSNCFCPPATFYKQTAEVVSSDNQCKHNEKYFYLKTFKTGSTTMLNILYRHMLSLNKTILMFRSWYTDRKYEAFYDDPQKVMLDYILDTPYLPGDVKYDALGEHLLYGQKHRLFYHQYFPPEHTFYFTTIREPFSRLESHIKCFSSLLNINVDKELDLNPQGKLPMSVQLMMKIQNDPQYKEELVDSEHLNLYTARNQQMRQLGLKKSDQVTITCLLSKFMQI